MLIARDRISSVLQYLQIPVDGFTACSKLRRKLVYRRPSALPQNSKKRQNSHDLPFAPARLEPKARKGTLPPGFRRTAAHLTFIIVAAGCAVIVFLGYIPSSTTRKTTVTLDRTAPACAGGLRNSRN